MLQYSKLLGVCMKIILLLIVYYIVGGGVIFGLYYLLYILTIKKKCSVQSTSLVVRMPLIISCIYILLVVVDALVTILLVLEYFSIPIGTTIDAIGSDAVGLYLVLVVPISMGSIAISFLFYIKKLMTRNRFILIILMNIIGIILLVVFLLWGALSFDYNEYPYSGHFIP